MIDGGNSYYVDDIVGRSDSLDEGIHYVESARAAACGESNVATAMMIGGEPDVGKPSTRSSHARAGAGRSPRTPGAGHGGTAEQGYLHCGPSGAGHFVKMVHNGIEYGLMAAYAGA